MKSPSFLTKSLVSCSMMVSLFIAAGCNTTPGKPEVSGSDSILVEDTAIDSTVYGTCGEGTTMHSLQLITDAGDTLQYLIGESMNDGEAYVDDFDPVLGGLLAGDRLAVIEGKEADGEKTAQRVINLTTLLGKWVSLDKNFEILEGGVVKSNLQAESKPWTSWKILNGKLLLNKDTFNINSLGRDSLYLESTQGIFTYKRP